jgi:hypothetical protein
MVERNTVVMIMIVLIVVTFAIVAGVMIPEAGRLGAEILIGK